MYVVTDTNALYVADRRHEVSPECFIACSSLLLEIMAGQHILVLDREREVLGEYLSLT